MAPALTARVLWGLAAGLSLAGLVLSSAAGVDASDEMWFLQVSARVADGDALYGDVFYGSTPLAVWLAVPGVAVLGSELLVVKALTAACVGALAAALAYGGTAAGLTRRSAVLLAVAFAVFAARLAISPYVALAMAAAAWSLVAAVAWRRGTGRRLLIACGALAGAAVAAKYTIGLLAVGVVGAVVLDRRPRDLRAAAIVAVSGLLVVAATLLPVALAGDLGRFFEYAFAAKGTYVEAGAVTYLDALRLAFGDLAEAVRSPSARSLEDASRTVAALAPLLAAGLFLAAWLRGRRTATIALCAIAAAAALAGAYPRFSTRHLAAALPGSALLAAAALSPMLPPASWLRRAALASAVLWIAANVVGGLVPKYDDAVVSSVPHLRGVVVSAAELRDWEADAAGLRAARGDGSLLVISSNAGLLYLLSDVPNPTPYDYPFVTAFGHDGEERTAARVRDGDIPVVCVDERIPDHFRPALVERAVRSTLRPATPLPTCRLYRG